MLSKIPWPCLQGRLSLQETRVSFEQGSLAEMFVAGKTRISAPVISVHVTSELGFRLETETTTFQELIESTMHGDDVPFQVVLAVGDVAAVAAAEQFFGAWRNYFKLNYS